MTKSLPIAGVSLLLFLLLIPLGGYGGGHSVKFTAANVAYCGFTYYLLSRRQQQATWKISCLILAPVFLLYFPVHASDLRGSMMAIPSTLAHISGVLAGILLTRLSSQAKVAFLVSFMTGSLWITTAGYDRWKSKINFGTYTGIVDEPTPAFLLKNSDGQSVNRASMVGKFVVLDFWNTSCGVCFKKFPELQQYYAKYKTSSNVQFFAVNSPLRRDTVGQAAATMQRYGYTFPVLYAENAAVDSAFNVHSFPTVIIIDSAQRIVYRGSLDGIDAVLSNVETGKNSLARR